MYPDEMKYPDSMLVRHLEAQVDRILDYDFGSVVSDEEYRSVGKTEAIIQKLYQSILDNGIDRKREIVVVGTRFLQEEYVNKLFHMIDKSHILPVEVRDNLSKAQLKKIVYVGNDDSRGYRLDGNTTTIFIDGVTKEMFKKVVKLMKTSEDTVFRGFINLKGE